MNELLWSSDVMTKIEDLGEKPDPCLFDKSKSRMDWPGIELDPPT
jgi:hypothetical protein